MSNQLAIVLGLLAAAIVMFAINKPRMDVVALIMLTALPLSGVITTQQALAGFSDANIILIAALFVIGEGLVRTGVAQKLGDWLTIRAGKSEVTLLVLLMLVVCLLGSIMSSTAVTAIFIPVAWRIAQSTGIAAGKLMMPLSFAALISGMMTLVATAPNLVVNSELTRTGAQGFHFFGFTPFGVVVLVLGIAYMYFARHWLPANGQTTKGTAAQPSFADWIAKYHLTNREHRVRIHPVSPLVGKSLKEIDLRQSSGASIIAIERQVRFSTELVRPTEATVLQAGDVLLVDVFDPTMDVHKIVNELALELLPVTGVYFNDRSQDIGMVEVIIPADSQFVGHTVADAKVRSRYGLSVIGLRRGQTPIDGPIRDAKLQIGDTLLLIGRWKDIARLQADSSDAVVLQLPSEYAEVLPAAGKALPAVACLLLVVGLMVSGVVPNVLAALIGCLLMGLFGCVDMTSAYNSINWKTLVLIVGMLPFSIALQETGGVNLAAQGLMSVIGGANCRAILAAIFAITALLGMFISNTATAVLMAPVALAIANDLKMSPYPFAMTVALAASTAFMTPVSSPVNTLVVGPGNYSFGDFVRVGVPFSIIVLVVTVLMVPWLLPL
jgi:di/tricarboxylate transporter